EAEHRLLRRDRGPVHGPRDDGHVRRAQEHHRADPERDGRARRTPRRVRDRRDEPRGPRRSGLAPAGKVRRDHRDPSSRPAGGRGDPADLPERGTPRPSELRGAIGGHKEAVEALRRFVLDELYGENKWVKVKLDAEAKEAIKTVKRKDIISGAIIEAIVTTAKKNFVKRVILLKKTERKKEGLSMRDLEMA